MKLTEIQNNKEYISILNEYIKSKNGVYLCDLVKFSHNTCPELRNFCSENELSFKNKNTKDKGLLGKLIEFYIFGKLPNSSRELDLEYADIKTTNVKLLTNGFFTSKERLALTNLGDVTKKEVLGTVIKKESIKNTKYYNKISKSIIFVCLFDKNNKDLKYRKILGIVDYNIENLDKTLLDQIDFDFNIIKNTLLIGKPTQSGQKFLHINRRSCGKENQTRCFSFTRRFLTILIANGLNLQLQKKGNSYYF